MICLNSKKTGEFWKFYFFIFYYSFVRGNFSLGNLGFEVALSGLQGPGLSETGPGLSEQCPGLSWQGPGWLETWGSGRGEGWVRIGKIPPVKPTFFVKYLLRTPVDINEKREVVEQCGAKSTIYIYYYKFPIHLI